MSYRIEFKPYLDGWVIKKLVFSFFVFESWQLLQEQTGYDYFEPFVFKSFGEAEKWLEENKANL